MLPELAALRRRVMQTWPPMPRLSQQILPHSLLLTRLLTLPTSSSGPTRADRDKDQLVDLLLFTKGYTVYATNYAAELKAQLKVLFLYDMITAVRRAQRLA